MKKKNLLGAAILAALLFGNVNQISYAQVVADDSTKAAITNVIVKPDYAQLDKDLQVLIDDKEHGVPGLGVAVVKNGKLTYEKTLGSRYIDNENPKNNLPLNRDTKLRIASISKTFTAVAYMQLVEQGKIDLDKDISEYLGFKLRNPNYPDVPITSRMLLSHTSSLRDGRVYAIAPEYSVEEFFVPDGKFYENGAHFAPEGEAPGKFFHYTNLNYGLLGTIIEKVTNTRFDDYMRNTVIKQMDIDASYNVADFSKKELKNLGVIYQKQSNGVWDNNGPWVAQIDDYSNLKVDHNIVYVNNPDVRAEDSFYDLTNYKIGTNATIFSPQGGLRISLKDLEKWMLMFINDGKYDGKQILSKESVDLMFEPYWTLNADKSNGITYGGLMNCYGLGIQNMRNIDKDRFLADRDIVMSGHFGEAYGLLAGMFVDREKKNGFIYVMNGMASSEGDNAGQYSGMYRWEERFCTAILNNAFKEL